MASSLITITEQYAQLYQEHGPDVSSFTFKPANEFKSMKSNPSGLTINIVRQLSTFLSAKPVTPPAGARGAICDLLDANFTGLDVETVRFLNCALWVLCVSLHCALGSYTEKSITLQP